MTDLPIAQGFLCRVAVMVGSSPAVLSWSLSNTMDADFCVAAIDQTLARHGRPEIVNIDQGTQFTGRDFTGIRERARIRIAMDGCGRWMDKVSVERLWRSTEYEDMDFKASAAGREAKAGSAAGISFDNMRRFHTALGQRTPSWWDVRAEGAGGSSRRSMLEWRPAGWRSILHQARGLWRWGRNRRRPLWPHDREGS